ncbi:LemA family protein [Sphingomonas aliaeris]|uniref:LemA family protein n=1 Tax=Sphingomonas aliaeris TaxID=2759526 RepID=A0A974NVY7_9SPHN|nr:LemA family protein [Sphingomonas aliaeris]QQV78029.1 LemA family protein [Sphingomonas aliaeris]
MILIWIVLGLLGSIAVALWWIVLTYARTNNTLIALDQRCDTAFADIDVHLKHRHNIIPGLVEVVRGVAEHERTLILGVAEARATALAAVAPGARLKAERDLSLKVSTLLAGAEGYPELRAVPEFGQLRQQLVDCENRITASRRFFNLAVEEYNVMMRQFPGSYIASKRRMNSRQPYDLGIERVLVDEPVSFAF